MKMPSPLVSLVFVACSACAGSQACTVDGSPSNRNGDSGGTGGTTPSDGGSNGNGGPDPQVGGSTSSGGTATSGGGSAGDGGGMSTGGTDASTGGSNGTGEPPGYTCPDSYTGMTPTLPSVALTPLAQAPGVGSEIRFLEGPVWDGTSLYVSQIRDWGDPAPSRILRLEGSSLVEFIPDERAGTNGLAVRGDGKLVGAAQRVGGLILIDPANPSEAPEIIVDEYDGKGFNSPNDLVLHSNGTIYFTDPTWQCTTCPQDQNRVYRVQPNNTVDSILPPHAQPNGIALSLDETILYVGGDNAGVYAYQLGADGSIGSSTQFASVTGTDGITLDCAGNVYITVHSQGRIEVYQPNGTQIGSINLASGSVTNMAFGGPNRTTLYITGGSNVYSTELDIPGLPY